MLRPALQAADLRAVKPAPKRADPELLTEEHRKWARKVIARADGECQDPKHKGDRRGHRLVADHILERRDRPDLALDLNNGRASCWSCHTRKTNEERAKRARATVDGATQQDRTP